MELRDIITNLKNHNFDIANYPLCRAEADELVKAAKRIEEEQDRMEDDGK